MKTLVNSYDNLADAQRTVQELTKTGLPSRYISLVVRTNRSGPPPSEIIETEHERANAALASTDLRTAEDAFNGQVDSLRALVIPDLGPSVAGGPLAVALMHSVAGSGTNELMGALVAGGVPREDARACLEAARQGKILVAAHCSDYEVRRAAEVMHAQTVGMA